MSEEGRESAVCHPNLRERKKVSKHCVLRMLRSRLDVPRQSGGYEPHTGRTRVETDSRIQTSRNQRIKENNKIEQLFSIE